MRRKEISTEIKNFKTRNLIEKSEKRWKKKIKYKKYERIIRIKSKIQTYCNYILSLMGIGTK